MKNKKTIILLTLCFLNFQFYTKAQNKDSVLVKKKNIVYLHPSAIGGDMFWNLENFWMEFGCIRRFPKIYNSIIDVKFGIIIYSNPTGISLLNDIVSKSTHGFNLNLEHKIILVKKLYYSTNLFYQNTKTFREGEYDKYSKVSDNTYTVIRSVYCFYPKIGFQFINRKNNIYTDIGFGAGIRYVSSNSINKINSNINSGYETFVNKEFDKGSKIAQKFYLQIKIGYNF